MKSELMKVFPRLPKSPSLPAFLTLVLLTASITLALAMGGAKPTHAQALADDSESANDSQLLCRDCPFPMRIGENRWLMPDESFVISIFESNVSDGKVSVTVRLTEPSTGKILATGSTQRLRDQHTVTVVLVDRNGGKINGWIRWTTPKHTHIQVNFECHNKRYCEF